MTRIFISYRRDDTLGLTGRIFDRLKPHFGPQSVLMDIDSIPVGVDFRQSITDAITKCNAMLAIIGDRWLRSGNDTKSRLDDPRDFVRLEIETAVDQRRSIIPVLIGNTPMPSEDQLPPTLKRLPYVNAIRIDPGRDFHHHMDRLIQVLEKLPGSQKAQSMEEPRVESTGAKTQRRSKPKRRARDIETVVTSAKAQNKLKDNRRAKDKDKLVEQLKWLRAKDSPSSSLMVSYGYYYIHFHTPPNYAGIFCEPVSNSMLTKRQKLGPKQIAEMRRLGFQSPKINSGDFYMNCDAAKESDFQQVADVTLSVFYEVYGCSPGSLTFSRYAD